MIAAAHLARWQSALPFWLSFLLLPLIWSAALFGGWAVLLPPLVTWYLFAALDGVLGLNLENADPMTPEEDLDWYRRLTSAWVPLQFISLFGLIYYVSGTSHLSGLEKFGVFFGVGVVTGTIGINYSHELMHQRNRLERNLADLAAGTGELCRALRADPQTSGRGEIRACAPASFLECRPQGLKLAADQPATPFGSSLSP